MSVNTRYTDRYSWVLIPIAFASRAFSFSVHAQSGSAHPKWWWDSDSLTRLLAVLHMHTHYVLTTLTLVLDSLMSSYNFILLPMANRKVLGKVFKKYRRWELNPGLQRQRKESKKFKFPIHHLSCHYSPRLCYISSHVSFHCCWHPQRLHRKCITSMFATEWPKAKSKAQRHRL